MTLFPAALDNLPTNETNETLAKDTHPKLHNDANEAINAIQAELGVNPSGEDASVAVRLDDLDAALAVLEGATVDSFAGRIGAVAPQAGDYDIPKITGLTAALEGKQPLDADLTAMAGLATTAYGRGLLTLADAAAGRAAFGLGTAATKAIGDFDAAGAADAAQAASQPLDADLTAVAGLATTAYGRSLLTLADAAAGRASFGAASLTEAETLDGRLDRVDQNTDWSAGDSVPIFVGKDQVGTHLNLKVGTAAAADEVFAPVAKVSRTISIAEAAFTGAGSLGLAAIAAVTKALATSQGQAIGIEAGAVTESSYVGEHSNADAFAGGFTGRSTTGSTRVGGGLFATGQRNNNEGKATGAEISCENNATEDGVYFPGAYSNVMALWVAPKGLHNAAAGIVLGHPEAAKFKYGLAANENAVLNAVFLDNSSAERSLQIKGAHAKGAITIAAGAGGIAVGAEEPTVANALLDVYYGESALTPGVVFGTDKAKNISVRVRNSTGELNLFAANTANNFVTGTAQGDTGITFSPGKVFHVGAVGKTSFLRVNEAGIAFNGAAPIAKQAAIGEPAETLAGHQAAIKSLREAVKNVGITA